MQGALWHTVGVFRCSCWQAASNLPENGESRSVHPHAACVKQREPHCEPIGWQLEFELETHDSMAGARKFGWLFLASEFPNSKAFPGELR